MKCVGVEEIVEDSADDYVGTSGVADECLEIFKGFVVVVFLERGRGNAAASVETVDQYPLVSDGGDSEEVAREVAPVYWEIEAVSDEHENAR